MNAIMTLLYILAAIASLACWIIVLIKMFKTEAGPLPGILGIICGLWAFIWGWMNAKKHGLQKIMLAWSVAWAVSIISGGVVYAKMMSEVQKQIQMQTP